MGFNREVVRRRRENLDIMGVQMRWVGSRARMWRSVIKEFDIAENMTTDNDVITVNYCVNYGGRAEIAEAARQIARDAAAGRSTLSGWTNERSRSTCTARHPRRRSVHSHLGEQRASNFMLWQAAYAEYVFQDKLWPDYDRRDLWAACEEYVNRNRRFGRA